ncbi:hypothetical protein CROQUDRAFT_44163 [Cronartium quercuum f. sp. fusiforme G11]|uniref:Uncharacterized protein n=1 Tax=Cronartium quercuum f. sp. fusiforme G11 TaxID=708437 RepID=A0A9P6TBS4_9BASI|nr:hypothetical protein CROQUDRAFT_44163 [Cronartium quercuum f. sp. fusiforme G11]
MSSPSEEVRRDYKIPPRSHPTPPSTPSANKSDSESDPSTARAISPINTVMSSEPSVLVIGTLGQRQAAAINNILSKITIKKPLDSNMWNSWSDMISLGLAGAMYDSYIELDKIPTGEDENLHLVIQKCIVTWMIANMDTTESERALGYLTSYGENGLRRIDYKPALLWTKMREYHASQSTHKRMTLCDALESHKQGLSKDLLKHMDEWQHRLKTLLEARKPITEEEKCSQLARSLNPKWREKAVDYIELGFN